MIGTLGDYARIILGGTPKTSNKEFWDGDIPWITPGDIEHSKHISTTARSITEAGLQGSNTKLLFPGDVVISARGTVGKVMECDRPMAFNQSCYAIRTLDAEVLHQKYVYYLIHDCVNYLHQNAGGAVFNAIVMSTLARTPVKIPPLATQHRIASILSAYDDLIENNRRRIQLLEESARLLYREWFVRLRFPGHEHVKIIDGVPEGWEKSTLGDNIVLNYGKSLKADDRIEGPYPVYGSSGIVGTHKKPLVIGPGIIIGRKGNVGSVFWSSKDFHPIDTVYYIDTASSDYYLYNTLQHMQFVSSDAAVP
jgi:type I restriction enzyme S subunit